MSDTTQIKALFERRERLEAGKQGYADDIKELNAEVKASGHDLKAFNIVIARRKKDRDALMEEDALVELYEDAAGGA